MRDSNKHLSPLIQQEALGAYFESLGFIAAISPNVTQQEIALNIICNGQYATENTTETLTPPILIDGLRSYLMHTKDLIKGKQAFETFLNHETTTLLDVIEVFVFHKGSVDFYNQMIEWVVTKSNQERLQSLIDHSEFDTFEAPENSAEAKALIKLAKKMFFPEVRGFTSQSETPPSIDFSVADQSSPSVKQGEPPIDQGKPKDIKKDEL
jgi:hypothetical protein